jgi:hypothetical protein
MSDTKQSELSEDEIRVNTLRQDVDRTRSQMSSTIQALQEKLEPEGLREKAASELENVEKHVKAAVREELLEVKAILKEELQEAKVAVNEVIANAKLAVKEDAIALKDSVKQDVIAAKDAVKEDVKHAIASAKRETRAATLGRLEDIATQAGDVMNDTKETLVETVRQNPIPAALVGFGLAWLLMNRSSSASQRRSGSFEGGSRERGVRTFDRGFSQNYGRDDSYPIQGSSSQGRSGIDPAGEALSGVRHRVDDLAHDATDAAGNALRKAKDAASSTLGHAADASSKLAHDVSDTASGLAHRVADAGSQLAHDAADKTSHLWHDATDASGRVYERVSSTVSEYAHEVPRQARRAEQAAEGYYMGNPLAIGAVALAAGALVGMALPRTDREDALLGEARDKFLINARSAAHDAAEAVQHLGQDAAQNVKGVLAESSQA